MSLTGTSTSSSRIRQDGCVTRNGHSSAFHIVSFGVHWLYHWFLYSTLLSHSSIAWAAHGLYIVDGKRPYLARHIRQRLARPTCRRLSHPLRMRGNGGVFVHLHDECTNQRKAIRRSDPVHHWGNRFSILYIRLSRFEAEVL